MISKEIRVAIGELVTKTMPYSEVCVHMKIADKPMMVRILEDGYAAQLYNLDGTTFSFPIIYSEAGLYRDTEGFYYHEYIEEDAIDSALLQKAVETNTGFTDLENIIAIRGEV